MGYNLQMGIVGAPTEMDMDITGDGLYSSFNFLELRRLSTWDKQYEKVTHFMRNYIPSG